MWYKEPFCLRSKDQPMEHSSNLALILRQPKMPLVLSTIPRVDESGLLKSQSLPKMAPHLAESQHALIKVISHSKQFKAEEIADVARCSPRAIYRIKKNLYCYGSTKAPSNSVGRPWSITPLMLDALCKHLLDKPWLYQDEMVDFLWIYFQVHVIIYSISKALASHG